MLYLALLILLALGNLLLLSMHLEAIGMFANGQVFTKFFKNVYSKVFLMGFLYIGTVTIITCIIGKNVSHVIGFWTAVVLSYHNILLINDLNYNFLKMPKDVYREKLPCAIYSTYRDKADGFYRLKPYHDENERWTPEAYARDLDIGHYNDWAVPAQKQFNDIRKVYVALCVSWVCIMIMSFM